MDKVILKFFTDVLYLKGIICFDEFEDIMDARNASDLDNVFEKMMRGEYNTYRRGGISYEFE